MKAVFADALYWIALANRRDPWRQEALAAREDKQYSLADCASMCVMDAEGIREVLTHDRHFEQEGYTVLMSGNRGRA